jgi:hypothetical protein
MINIPFALPPEWDEIPIYLKKIYLDASPYL